ncbi:leucine-rich repeat domain-containing protein [Paenibacillus sp. SI8]|uniref:leucine-rich repeat domain-containing protein n=1 Tax=unclassified Paenibacillus TaxID=185978 RepID=UPI003464ED46
MRPFVYRLSFLAATLSTLVSVPVTAAGAIPLDLKLPEVVSPIKTIPVPADPNAEAVFKDQQLEAKVRTLLGMKQNEIIRKSDITNYCKKSNYDIFSLDKSSIKSLEGIEAFADCENWDLVISGNRISDLTPLGKLPKLGSLYLGNNYFTDIKPLATLTNLTDLNLSSNRVADIATLSKLTKLTRIDLSNSSISDLSPLTSLSSLTYLKVKDNQIADLTPLQGLTKLESLDASGNHLTDLNALSNLTKLTRLQLRNNQITDISPLQTLQNLEELELGNNRITRMAPLSGLSNLQDIEISDNQVSDLGQLSGLTKLHTLNLANNQVSDLRPLIVLPEFHYLNVSYNQLSDIEPLSKLTSLFTLNISHNRIKSIVPLQNLNSLSEIDASGNWISNLEPLQYTKKLKKILLTDNAINTDNTSTKNVIDYLVGNKVQVTIDNQNPRKPEPPSDEVPKTVSFTDIEAHWAKKDIEWALEIGMVGGVAPGIFSPDTTTSEEQFLKMLLLAMKGVAEQPESTPWSEKYYVFAANHNYPVNNGQRDKSITRTAVAELVAATQGVNASGDRAIQYLLDKKLSEGKTAATVEGYQGGDSLTRAESVRFIRNVLSNAAFKSPQTRPN